MLTPAQARMARAALSWSLVDVQEKTDINKNTVVRFEAGKGVLLSTVLKLERAFTKEGIIFIDETGEHGHGLLFSKDLQKKLAATPHGPKKPKSGKRSQKI